MIRIELKRPLFISTAIFLANDPAPALAEAFNVPPGPLGTVVTAIGREAGATVILTDPVLANVRSPGVRAQMPLRDALARALRGTGAEALFVSGRVVQIRKRTAQTSHRPVLGRPSEAKTSVPEAMAAEDIVVSASKQDVTLAAYPGSAKIVPLDEGWFPAQAADGSSAIARLTPALGSTNLGNGRNKLFIRGIADSSFSGPTQATTGQYLGDVRLTYNAPDPDLNLYDMKKFEVLAGPQGTLYGPSSLGGIIRLVPNAPDSSALFGSASTGLGITRHGAASLDAAGMINVPLSDNVAARWVAFAGRAGGYIDAPAQGRRNINDTVSYGQRLTFRFDNLGAWSVDVGNVFQNFRSGDGQYVLRGDPPFTRSGTVPQPFENNYRLVFAKGERALGSARLTTVTSLARQDLSTVFDATGYDGTADTARLREQQQITLLSHETRVTGGPRNAPWIVGIALARSTNRRTLSLGTAEAWGESGGLQDDQLEAAIFAQASRRFLSSLTATLGARLTSAHSTRETFAGVDAGDLDGKTGNARRLSGTVGLVWQAKPDLSIFADYRHGYRPGGLGFTLTGDTVVTKQYAPDDLRMLELGLRVGRQDGPVHLEATHFWVDWHNIQADQVGPYVIPYTTNIGRGTVRGVDLELVLRPSSALTLSGSGFFNDSRLRDVGSEFANDDPGAASSRLPNVPRRGARLSATWETTVISVAGTSAGLRLDGALRYVGPSRLGVGSYLSIPQGDYLTGDLSARLDLGKTAISFTVSNVTDSHGNTFSYGNPFSVGEGDQMTPLRPRTIRLGLTHAF